MIVIAFAGPGGAGKSTAANLLVERAGFTKVSFAAPLYDMLEAGGFGRPKTLEEKQAVIPHLGFSWRHAAQTLGTEWGRRLLREDIWQMIALGKCSDPNGRYAIDDCRFDNEADPVRALPGGHVVHLVGRAGNLGALGGHVSESGVTFKEGDHRINNSFDDPEWLARDLTTLLDRIGR